ncbi:MAG: hypothetical protein MJZ02_03475 [Paludibacteraceae bacterium]|nr:hypothetical protein [Paludibacteraceae bacterium]
MLKRVAAHWLIVRHGEVKTCAGVSLDHEGVVREIFSLADVSCEPAGTTFLDGYIAPFLADVSTVPADELKNYLQDVARLNNASLCVGAAATLFNYSVAEDGTVVVTSISDLFTNKK